MTNKDVRSFRGELTSSNLFACRCTITNWLIFSFSIHSDTIANWFSVIITPSRGNTFGCRRAFQVMTSLQNLCEGYHAQLASAQGNLSPPVTHLGNIPRTTMAVRLENLDRDPPATIFTLPHVPKPAAVQRDAH